VKGLLPLFLGIFGTFVFSWAGLVFVPDIQIGHLDPQSDEEGTDIYPMPQSGMVERGRHIYAANGCVYCHSQQIRADYAGSDLDRTRDVGPQPRPKWGDRRSAPRDYIFDHPVLLGKMRMGPDLANIGHAGLATDNTAAVPVNPSSQANPSPVGSPGAPNPLASPAVSPAPAPASSASPSPAGNQSPSPSQEASPIEIVKSGVPPRYSAAWHHRHLYNPRSLNLDSIYRPAPDSDMPSYRFLYETRKIGHAPSDEALNFSGDPEDAPPAGWEIVPTYDAECLVAYLMSLDQSHPLKEVKSTAPVTASPAPAKPAK